MDNLQSVMPSKLRSFIHSFIHSFTKLFLLGEAQTMSEAHTQDMTDHRPRFSHRRDSSSTATRNWASTDFKTSPTLTANTSSPPRMSLHIAFYT